MTLVPSPGWRVGLILPATARGSWQPHWLDLLEALRDVVPADWLVLALTDRGLWAPWLFHKL